MLTGEDRDPKCDWEYVSLYWTGLAKNSRSYQETVKPCLILSSQFDSAQDEEERPSHATMVHRSY